MPAKQTPELKPLSTSVGFFIMLLVASLPTGGPGALNKGTLFGEKMCPSATPHLDFMLSTLKMEQQEEENQVFLKQRRRVKVSRAFPKNIKPDVNVEFAVETDTESLTDSELNDATTTISHGPSEAGNNNSFSLDERSTAPTTPELESFSPVCWWPFQASTSKPTSFSHNIRFASLSTTEPVPTSDYWTCQGCLHTRKSLSDRCNHCGSRNTSVTKMFLGQLHKDSSDSVAVSLINMLAPAVKILHVESHLNRNTGKGKGCVSVYVDSSSLDANTLLAMNHRAFIDVDDVTGELGAYVATEDAVEALKYFAEGRQRRLNRAKALSRGPITVEYAKETRPTRREVAHMYENSAPAATFLLESASTVSPYSAASSTPPPSHLEAFETTAACQCSECVLPSQENRYAHNPYNAAHPYTYTTISCNDYIYSGYQTGTQATFATSYDNYSSSESKMLW